MNILDYIVIAAYLGLLLWLGFGLRQQESKAAYFLGSRELGWPALTLSVMATQLSAISFVSAPAFVGLRENGGLKWLTYEFALPLAIILLLGTVLPKLYRSGVISIYDYLEQRFGRSSRLLLSFVFQISRAFATGIMVYAVSIILQSTMQIEFWQSIIVIGIITMLYSLQGGMKAVVYGDALQMIIIFLGTLVCIGFGLYHLGGISAFIDQVDSERLVAVDFNAYGVEGDSFGFLPMLFGGIVLYASYYGCDQTQAQRALAAKSPEQLTYIMLGNAFLRFPMTLLYCASGLVIGTLAMTTPSFLAQIPQSQPDWLIPIFILNYLPHGIIGLLVVAILAAAMSSLSSTINSLAAVTLEDILRIKDIELDEKRYLLFAKIIAFIWGIVTLALSFYAGDIATTVIEAINKVGSVFYGPILSVFLLAVLFPKLTAVEVNTGLILGVATNCYLWLAEPQIFWFWWNFIGFVLTLVAALLLAVFRGRFVFEKTTDSLVSKTQSILLLIFFVLMIIVSISLQYL